MLCAFAQFVVLQLESLLSLPSRHFFRLPGIPSGTPKVPGSLLRKCTIPGSLVGQGRGDRIGSATGADALPYSMRDSHVSSTDPVGLSAGSISQDSRGRAHDLQDRWGFRLL